jgi:hypothetical protein
MLSQEIVALLEEAVAKTGHECGHAREEWGGLPVAIMFGDDYQLPALGKPGATSIPIISTNNTKGHHDMTQNQGALQFINLAEHIMELDQVVRQREDQQHFKGLSERMRLGWLTDQDEHRLRTLILYDDNYTSKEIKDQKKPSICFQSMNLRMRTMKRNYKRRFPKTILWLVFAALIPQLIQLMQNSETSI